MPCSKVLISMPRTRTNAPAKRCSMTTSRLVAPSGSGLKSDISPRAISCRAICRVKARLTRAAAGAFGRFALEASAISAPAFAFFACFHRRIALSFVTKHGLERPQTLFDLLATHDQLKLAVGLTEDRRA